MAEATHEIDFVEVKAEDILAERARGWDQFTKAAKWSIGAIAVLLLAIYVFWG